MLTIPLRILGITTRSAGGHHVVALDGELDVSEAARVLLAVHRTPPSDTTVVDLSGLRFIDAGGVDVQHAARHVKRIVGGELVLRGAQPQPHHVFEVVGLLELLHEVQPSPP